VEAIAFIRAGCCAGTRVNQSGFSLPVPRGTRISQKNQSEGHPIRNLQRGPSSLQIRAKFFINSVFVVDRPDDHGTEQRARSSFVDKYRFIGRFRRLPCTFDLKTKAQPAIVNVDKEQARSRFRLVRRLDNERRQRLSATRAMCLRHGMTVGDLQAAQAIREGAEPIGPRFPPGTRQMEQASCTGRGWSFVLGACETPAQDFFN